MPMVVYLVGVVFTTEKFTLRAAINMIVVGTGIGIASYGGRCAPPAMTATADAAAAALARPEFSS
jgi:hypothetical protein